MLWFFGFYRDEDRFKRPPKDFIFPYQHGAFDESKPSLCWIGHSTFLVQALGYSFLTDPIFGTHCSPIPLKWLKRRAPPALQVSELPSVDVVLISHNHYDHLDAGSVDALHRNDPNITWVVPRGVKIWFTRRGIERVHELGWGESVEIGTCSITSVPAQHFSGRGLFDQNKTLWCGYVVQCRAKDRMDEKIFYFVGDTGYNPVQFKQIGERFSRIDLSLIPIGAYVPKQFMNPVHINPFEAVELHCDAGSRLSVGMHWDTFVLSEEDPKLPPYDLLLALQQKKLPPSSFFPVEIGRRVNW